MNQYAGWFGTSQYNSTLYFQRPLGMGDGTASFLGWNIAPQGEPPWLSTFLQDTSAEQQKVLRGFWELSNNMRSKLSRLKTCSYRMELEPPIILQRQRYFINPPQIPASLLGEFLRALPSSCTSLEFRHLCNRQRWWREWASLLYNKWNITAIAPSLTPPKPYMPESFWSKLPGPW